MEEVSRESTRPAKPIRKEMPITFFAEEEKIIRPPSVTIGRPVDEVYSFFRDFANLPKFMKNLKEVDVISPSTYLWIFESPHSFHTFNVEIVTEEKNSLIAWKCTENSGVATFEKAAGDRGTIVSLKMESETYKGKIAGVASYFLGKEVKLRSDINLRRLKAYLETGEIPTVEGQPNGRDEDIKIHLQ